MSDLPLNTLPRRRFLAIDRTPELDELGFLAPESVAESFGADDLFELCAVLVLAPPWTGKTLTAKQLRHHFRENQNLESREAPFGSYFHGTLFEELSTTSPVQPGWFREWQDTSKRACWIIDAIDEDAKMQRNKSQEVMEIIEGLTGEQRARLCVIVFCRENEVPRLFVNRLEVAYPEYRDSDRSALRTVRLAPIDRVEAEYIAGAGDAFKRVCDIIEKNHLAAISQYPCVIQSILRLSVHERLDAKDVWTDILRELLKERRDSRVADRDWPSLDDLFEATTRIAVVLQFDEIGEICTESSLSKGPSIDDVFRSSPETVRRLRGAARAALHSAVFARTASGFRFAQKHTQEWFSALALKKLSLGQLRPLFSDNSGQPIEVHRGVSAIVYGITDEPTIKEWISELHGGLVPRSDAAPWSLETAMRVLDRLQDLARKSQSGLHLWSSQALAGLKSPGLGDELSKRLALKGINDFEKCLLLEVAHAVRATEALDYAESIVRNDAVPDRIRILGALILRDVADDRRLQSLLPFVESADHSTRSQRDLISCLLEELLERRLISHGQAIRLVPARSGTIDFTALLHQKLAAGLSLDDARKMLREVHANALDAAENTDESDDDLPATLRGRAFLKRAIDLVAGQEIVSDADLSLLQPIALRRPELRITGAKVTNILELFRRSRDARRRLFQAGIALNPRNEPRFTDQWRWALTDEDLDWLLDLAKSSFRTSPWLLGELLWRAAKASVDEATRSRVRSAVKAIDPNVVRDSDNRMEAARAQEARLRARQEAREARRRTREYALAELVIDAIESAQLDACGRMRRLSWLCFTGQHIRPTNVRGDWADLDESLKHRVIAVCEEALRSCEPTPIPASGEFPGTIIYEAHAFEKVSFCATVTYPTSDQIIRWLPTALFVSSMDRADLIRRCNGVDSGATARAIIYAIRHDLSGDRGGAMLASSLPSDMWSSNFCERIAELINDESLLSIGRSELLRYFVRRDRKRAHAIAIKWAAQESGTSLHEDEMRIVAIDALCQSAPAVAMDWLERIPTAARPEALKSMHSFTESDRFGGIDLGSWSAIALERLCYLLNEAIPARENETTTARSGGWEKGEPRIRYLRDAIPTVLFKRADEDSSLALDRLANRYARIRNWRDDARIQYQAEGVARLLHSGPAKPGSLGAIPVQSMIRLLDDAAFRIIRGNNDLQRVLVEELRAIGRNAKEHLSLLYFPYGRGGSKKGNRKKRRASKRAHLNEDALQAYLLCRLSDRLPDKSLDPTTTVTFINREPLGTRDQRLDLKVQAPTVDGSRAEVIVEVKWSDHREVGNSLRSQLGARYLRELHLTHGIYLVGWCGSRPRVGGPRQGSTPPFSMDEFQERLERQADEFAVKNDGMSIASIVLDLVFGSLVAEKGVEGGAKRRPRDRSLKRTNRRSRRNSARPTTRRRRH